MYTETNAGFSSTRRRTRYDRSKAVTIKGMGVSAYLIVLNSQLKRKVRATVVEGSLHYAVVDIIPDELKNDVPGRDKSNKKRVGSYMRRFLRKNLGDDLRTAKMRSEGKGVRDMLVVSEEGLSVIATYVYHKAQGFDFRSCYSALPGELAVKAPVRDWEAGNRAFA